MNAAGKTLIPPQTPVRTKMDYNQTGRREGAERTSRQCQCIPAWARRSPAQASRRRIDRRRARHPADILAGLINDKGGEQQIGTAERILAEIINSDVALLVTFNQAIDGVLKSNQKARQNPKAFSAA
jgi:hypothetical protein